jgi:hypothetical protein
MTLDDDDDVVDDNSGAENDDDDDDSEVGIGDRVNSSPSYATVSEIGKS